MDWSRYLSQQGRKGDSLIAHITPEEANILKALGGSGTINPRTGLREFYAGGAGGEGDPGGGEEGGYDTGGMPGGEDPGSVMGDIGGLLPGLTDEEMGIASIPGIPEALTTIEPWYEPFWGYVKAAGRYGWPVASTALAFVTGGWTAAFQAALVGGFKAATGISPTLEAPVRAMLGEVVKGFGKFGSKESIAATAQAFNEMNAESLSGKPGSFDVASTPVGTAMTTNEKTLDALMTKFGEIGDYGSAIKAAKTFENQATIRARLESEISRYSGDPEYQVIEPEFRVAANAAIDKGMDPKGAADSAFKRVKESYAARILIREYLDRTRKKMEATA